MVSWIAKIRLQGGAAGTGNAAGKTKVNTRGAVRFDLDAGRLASHESTTSMRFTAPVRHGTRVVDSVNEIDLDATFRLIMGR